MAKESDSPVSGIFVPIAIVVGGALIIWSITKMLGTTAGYKRLVEELHSKTFGNRWVAAYELSKYISTEQIPKEDIPWLVGQLKDVYIEAKDPRTKNFIILASSALKSNLSVDILNMGLEESDEQVVFNSIVAIGNLESSESVEFDKLRQYLKSDDPGLRQVSLLAMSKHNMFSDLSSLNAMVSDKDRIVRYTAVTVSLAQGTLDNLSVAGEVFALEPSEQLNPEKIQALQLNVLNAILKNKNKGSELINFIENNVNAKHGLTVKTKAEQVLIELKNQ